MKLSELVEQIKRLPPEKRVEALKQLRIFLKKREEQTKQGEEAAIDLLEEAELEQAAIEKITVPQQKKVDLEELFKEKKDSEQIERKINIEREEEVKRFAERTTQENFLRAQELRREQTPSYEQKRELYDIAAGEELKRIRGYEDNEQSRKQLEKMEEGNMRKYARTIAEEVLEHDHKYARSQSEEITGQNKAYRG
ncbi:hypothetical protein HY486_00610 [Candidatus Woesearchaeota archaeon]|nr:hypothetical protein [Candidatus Woesearchaeota archaeon]